MDRLTALGTGNAAVTRCYNTCFLLDLPQGYLLCDAGGGNGILSQLEKAGVDLAQIHHPDSHPRAQRSSAGCGMGGAHGGGGHERGPLRGRADHLVRSLRA